jgi:hypothetical protein
MLIVRRRFNEGHDPVALWRTLAETDFDQAIKTEVSAALKKRCPLNCKRWRAALRGDAPAAIDLALEVLSDDARHDHLDFCMTAVLVCALDGNPAARLVLSHALRTHFSDIRSTRLATSWLMANITWAARNARRRNRLHRPEGPLDRPQVPVKLASTASGRG